MSSMIGAARSQFSIVRFGEPTLRPTVTFSLVMISVSVMLCQIFAQLIGGPDQAQRFGEQWGLIAATWEWTSLHSLASLFTFQFLHANALHFLSNMILLLLAGVAVEQRVGSRATLLIVLIGGALAGFAHLLWAENETLPLIGASGLASVLLGMALVVGWRWRAPIRIWPGKSDLFSISLRLAVLLWLIVQVYGLITSTPAAGSSNVAYISHLTGFAFGAACLGGASLVARRQNRLPLQLPAPAVTAGD